MRAEDGPAPPHPRPVVLAVDDDPVVRAAACGMLARLGYEPLLARDGPEAVYLLDALRGEVRAAVLDVRMPAMDGPATLAALRRLRPDLPCLFLTGFADHPPADLLALGAAGVLGKPVTPAQLGGALAAAGVPAAG